MADSATGARRQSGAAGRRPGSRTGSMTGWLSLWTVVAVVLWTGVPGALHAAAKKAPASSQSVQGVAQSAKKAGGKVSFMEAPSHEKPADRERRLKRECKGRPNAGACLGHTR